MLRRYKNVRAALTSTGTAAQTFLVSSMPSGYTRFYVVSFDIACSAVIGASGYVKLIDGSTDRKVFYSSGNLQSLQRTLSSDGPLLFSTNVTCGFSQLANGAAIECSVDGWLE